MRYRGSKASHTCIACTLTAFLCEKQPLTWIRIIHFSHVYLYPLLPHLLWNNLIITCFTSISSSHPHRNYTCYLKKMYRHRSAEFILFLFSFNGKINIDFIISPMIVPLYIHHKKKHTKQEKRTYYPANRYDITL